MFRLHWHRHGDTEDAPDPIEIPEDATHVSIEHVPDITTEAEPEAAPPPEVASGEAAGLTS